MPSRSQWTILTDAQLLAQCAVDTYRASGPGGQKRNKTSSAVRLRHGPSGLIVIAEESRSQHENKARALRRLRRALYLQIREPAGRGNHPDLSAAKNGDGRLTAGPKNPAFWPAAGRVLDALADRAASVRDTAVALGVTTANLIDFLRADAKLWQTANHLRSQYGKKPLH